MHVGCSTTLLQWRGDKCGNPEEKEVRVVWMAGVEGSGSRICKAAGSGRYRGKFCNILQSKKCKKVVSNKNRAGTEIGSGKVKPNPYR